MSEYERLMAYFKIAYEDLSVLHHNAVGEGFFEAHEQLDTLYGLIAGFSDEIIERGIALGYKEPNIAEAVAEFGDDILPVADRSREQSYEEAKAILRACAGFCAAAEPSVPPDVQNKLQEIEYTCNHWANYLLEHATK